MPVAGDGGGEFFKTYKDMEKTANNQTPATMAELAAAIAATIESRKVRSRWSGAVKSYALELAERLEDWDRMPASVADLRGMLLNGADNWSAYSWGGSSLIYNGDIAERVCTPSELRRATGKNGLRDMANACEHWLDVQARALSQAARVVVNAYATLFNA